MSLALMPSVAHPDWPKRWLAQQAVSHTLTGSLALDGVIGGHRFSFFHHVFPISSQQLKALA